MSVDLASFKPGLQYLTAGGEGTIYRLHGEPRAIYKEYKPASLAVLNASALERIIEFPHSLSAPDFARLDSRTVWPKAPVTRQGQVVGFIMRAIPDRYYALHGLRANPKRVLCDWNQLAYQSSTLGPHMMSEVPRLNTPQRIELIQDLAMTMEMLHRYDVVIGDMSGRNLIWAGEPLRVAIIDCDSFRFERGVGALPHKESPGWADPTLEGAPTSKSSDVYKLGVAAYRVLWSRPPERASADWVTSQTGTRVHPDLRALIAASIDRVGRPTAADWTRTLDRLYSFDVPQVPDPTPLFLSGVNSMPAPSAGSDAVDIETGESCPFCGGKLHEPTSCPFFLRGGMSSP